MKIVKIFSALLFVSFLLSSCSDNDDNNNPTHSSKITLEDVIASTIDNVVIPSYKNLNESYDAYYNSVSDLAYDKLTQSQIDEASQLFIKARNDYEYTESFFFGADNHFEVDTEINQWPLDVMQCEMKINSDDDLSSVEGWPTSIVGWHGIEYILFRDGQPRKVSDITPREWQYLQTLTSNLRLRCKQLLCGWDASASQSDKDLLTQADLKYTSPLGGDYRTYMTTNFTAIQAANAMLVGDHGMMGLSDEIALTKLGRPHNQNDAGYIESPYSHQSVNDMVYNLRSIRNMWYGTLVDNTRATSIVPSFYQYFKDIDSNLATQISQSIDDSESAVAAIQSPFTEHYMDATVETAIEKVNALSAVLDKANNELTK